MKVEQLVRQKWRLLKAILDERGKRLWAGAEADAIGRGGVARVARATKLAISTVPRAEMKFVREPSAKMSSTCAAAQENFATKRPIQTSGR